MRALQACGGWVWFVGEITQDMEKLTRRVMEEDLSAQDRERLILEYRALKTALERPASILEGAERVVASSADGLAH